MFERPQTIVPRRLRVPPVAGANLEPSTPAGYRPAGGQAVTLPGAAFAPAGGVAVDQIGDGNLAPGAIGTLLSIAVPPMLRFRIAGIGFGANDEVALGFLTWAILLNGDPAPSGYSAQPAAVGSIRQLSDIFLVASAEMVVTVRATIAAGAVVTYRYLCRMRGWFYTEEEAR